LSLRPTPQQAQLTPLSGLVASKSRWQRWVTSSLDLLFPPRCVGCERIDYNWCPDCQQSLKQLAIAPQLRRVSADLKLVSTETHHGLLATAIHAFKYQQTPELYMILSERLSQCLHRWNITPDVIVPVPLHEKRHHERGYNQSALLVAGLSELTGIPYQLDLLHRITDTQPQVGLDQYQRMSNVNNAFHAEPVNNLTILLVDDVTTTGATLNQCALTLKRAGASQTYGLTVTCA
jgi:ComF family protein